MRLLMIVVLVCFLFGCQYKQSSVIEIDFVELKKRLERALASVVDPSFSVAPQEDFSRVQSPFVSRKKANDENEYMTLLFSFSWQLVGEVRKEKKLLGVFLRSQNKLLYFGLTLPVENSSWRVLALTVNTVVVENSQQHLYRTLYYHA